MLKFTYDIVPDNVVIIGCGGTGSRLVPLIAQILSSQDWMLKKRITLIDDDVVEEKNLKRQLFIEPDLGRNKAEVLAERYSNAFNIDIFAVNSRIPGDEALTRLIRRGATTSSIEELNTPVVIMCVDSVESRLEILSELQRSCSSQTIIIDTGNEDIFGQVSIFNNILHSARSNSDTKSFKATRIKAQSIEERSGFTQELRCIPIPYVEYLDTPEGKGTGSCADLDQTLAINNIIAANVAGIFQNLVYSIPLEFHTLRVSLNGGNSTEWLSNKWLKSVFEEGPYLVSNENATVLKGLSKLAHSTTSGGKSLIGHVDRLSLVVPSLVDCVESVCTKQAMEMAGEEVPS